MYSLAPTIFVLFHSKCFYMRTNSKFEPDSSLNPDKCPFAKPTSSLVKDSGQITVSGANHSWSLSLALCRECLYLIPRSWVCCRTCAQHDQAKLPRSQKPIKGERHFTSILPLQTGILLCSNFRVQSSNLL